MNPEQIFSVITPARCVAMVGILLLAGAAFAVGRWTAPAHPSTNYVTTRTGGTGAIVTETHSGKVWTIDLRDTMNGKMWQPPAERAETSQPVSPETRDAVSFLVAVVIAVAGGAAFYWFSGSNRRATNPPSPS